MALRRGRCRLLEHLSRCSLNQAEFVRRMRVAKSSVTRWIDGSRMILGCHAEELYEWEEDKSNRQ